MGKAGDHYISRAQSTELNFFPVCYYSFIASRIYELKSEWMCAHPWDLREKGVCLQLAVSVWLLKIRLIYFRK